MIRDMLLCLLALAVLFGFVVSQNQKRTAVTAETNTIAMVAQAQAQAEKAQALAQTELYQLEQIQIRANMANAFAGMLPTLAMFGTNVLLAGIVFLLVVMLERASRSR